MNRRVWRLLTPWLTQTSRVPRLREIGCDCLNIPLRSGRGPLRPEALLEDELIELGTRAAVRRPACTESACWQLLVRTSSLLGSATMWRILLPSHVYPA